MIVLASELIASGADTLKRRADPTFLGGSILGLVANLPDIFIVVAAVATYSGSLALAAILGGNIFTFTLGYALVIASNLYFNREELALSKGVREQLVYLGLATVLIGLGALLGAYYWWLGLAMIILYSSYMVKGVRREALRASALRKRLSAYTPQQVSTMKSIVEPGAKTLVFGSLKVVAGCFLLGYSATPFVAHIGRISEALGLPLFVSGVVLAPLAAEAPEIVSGIALAKRSVEDSVVAVSNLIGSKIQNNTLVFGLAVLVSDLLGRPVLSGGNLAAILLIVALNTYCLRATYDLVLTKRDALVSLALYPLAIASLAAVTVFLR